MIRKYRAKIKKGLKGRPCFHNTRVAGLFRVGGLWLVTVAKTCVPTLTCCQPRLACAVALRTHGTSTPVV
eukprot:150177-Amphidinium_carterae.1